MKNINFLSPAVVVAKARGKGRGIFAAKRIKANTIIETSPVLVMDSKDRKILDKTLLHNYIFEWGEDKKSCCLALGYVSLYNHSYQSNCEYEMDYKKELLTIRTLRRIEAGEQLCINYNGAPGNDTPLWFEVK